MKLLWNQNVEIWLENHYLKFGWFLVLWHTWKWNILMFLCVCVCRTGRFQDAGIPEVQVSCHKNLKFGSNTRSSGHELQVMNTRTSGFMSSKPEVRVIWHEVRTFERKGREINYNPNIKKNRFGNWISEKHEIQKRQICKKNLSKIKAFSNELQVMNTRSSGLMSSEPEVRVTWPEFWVLVMERN